MKFALALLAVVAAQDEEAAEGDAAAPCGGPCADGECCGTVSPAEAGGDEEPAEE